MKVLMITNKVRTYALGFQNVILPLKELNHEIVWAADFSQYSGDRLEEIPCKTEQISIHTSPLNPSNMNALFQIRTLIKKYSIEAVVCSTPIGGFLARLAAWQEHISHVAYTAHGFLFFRGAPIINQTVYKLEEYLLAHITDTLITITPEDYRAAEKFHLRGGKKPFLIHGAGIRVGVDVICDRTSTRERLGIPENAFLIVSAGELNKNKNTISVLKALIKLNRPDIHYIACGDGKEYTNLLRYAKRHGITDRFHLVGYRTDVPEIMACSDAYVIMSYREGLPRALMEAMDLGLPCIGSDTRGVRDLIDPCGGFICKMDDTKSLANRIAELYENPTLCQKMGKHNQKVVKKYSCDIVRSELTMIYRQCFGTEITP